MNRQNPSPLTRDFEDPLKFLRHRFILMIEHKILRLITFYTLMYVTIEGAIGLVLIIMNDLRFALYFSCIVFSEVHCTITLWPMIVQYTKFKQLYEVIKKQFWSLDSAGPQALREVNQIIKYTKIKFYISSVVAFIGAFVFTPFSGKIDYDNTFHLTILILKYVKLPSFLRDVVIVINYITLYFIGFALAVYPFALMYHVLHVKIQFILLGAHFRHICNDIVQKHDKKRLEDNQKYQDVVYRRLCFCIKRHIQLKNFANNVIDLFANTLFLHAFSGVALGTTLPYVVAVHRGLSEPIASSSLLVGASLTAFYYAGCGEVFQRLMDDLVDESLKCNWETFNVKNKKCFLLYLLNSKEPLIITGGGIFNLNYQLLLWIVHKSVSMLSAFMVLEGKKKTT